MAKGVEIPITAIDNASAVTNKIEGELKQLEGVQKTGTATTKAASFGWTELNSAMMIGERAVQVLGDAYEKTVTVTVEYAKEVRDLKEISGTGAEETSRFIQVLDDYEISTQDAMTATRAMTKQGLVPNIETLAQLSDQYLSISDAQERNEFVIKNLGRAGLEWVNVLRQGGDALREQGAAVDKNLILDEKAVQQAEDYRLAQDALQDSVTALAYAIGTELIPVMKDATTDLTEIAGWVSTNYEEITKWGNVISWVVAPHLKLGKAIGEWSHDVREGTEATEDAKGPTEDLADSVDDLTGSATYYTEAALEARENTVDLTAAIKDMTEANKEFLDITSDLQGILDDYHEAMGDLNATEDELLEKKQELIAQGYGPESEAIQEINQKLDENAAKKLEAASAAEEATKREIAALLERKLMADGVLNDTELAALLALKQEWGLMSAEAVAAAQLTNSAISQYLKTGDLNAFMLAVGGLGDSMTGARDDTAIAVPQIDALAQDNLKTDPWTEYGERVDAVGESMTTTRDTSETALRGVAGAVDQYLQTADVDNFRQSIDDVTNALNNLPESKSIDLNINFLSNGQPLSPEALMQILNGLQ